MPVVLGQVVSRTGTNPGGCDNERGARLAVDELNAAGGLLGQPVELVVADDRTSPAHAVKAFAEVVQAPVAGVVGTSFSNASLAIIPAAETVRVPYVSTGAADSQVDPVRPFAFMTPPTASAVAEQLLRYCRAHGLAKVALVGDENSVFARTGLGKHLDLAPGHGVEWTHIERFPMGTTEFAALFERVRGSGAQAVMAWVTGPPAVELVRQRPRDLPLLMSHGNSDRRFLDLAGPAAEGVVAAASLGVVARDLPESPVRDAAVALANAFEARHGYAPSLYTVDGYTAVKLLAAAVAAAGSADPSQVRDALEAVEVITPQGEYRYTATDHHGLTARHVAVTVVDGGRFVPTPWCRDELTATRQTRETPQ
ncbi:ABC transporter substrate-binding protein [Amycolatopsis dendrobii]|uniref:ABC transporter substrate-binding protein n=1 Tax=Amycolatopsis dendrobii TaxID=2760662 RepID=A0A7W3W161_9PSEU|nr:ABC transporter substrate-binding protein [Amycolatopsis dendrobii]MBB1156948.1 ABC transporter substrate-binding protein [Amycolatopsis dendrobii]